MSTILDIAEVRQRVSRLSVSEYHRLGEFNENRRRTELIRGIIIEKMPKSPLHRIICSRLYKLLMAQVSAGFSVWKEEPLTLTDSEPEPDLSVTRGDETNFAMAHPTTAELVVEVAVSSAALDRANTSLYAEARVQEYWIILGEEQKVEVYRQPQDNGYEQTSVLGLTDTLDCPGLPGVSIPISELFSPT